MNLKPLYTVFHGRVLATSSKYLFLGLKKMDEVAVERPETGPTRSPAAGQFENISASASGVKLTIPISPLSYEHGH